MTTHTDNGPRHALVNVSWSQVTPATAKRTRVVATTGASPVDDRGAREMDAVDGSALGQFRQSCGTAAGGVYTCRNSPGRLPATLHNPSTISLNGPVIIQ